MSEFRDLEQISGQTAHQIAGPYFVIEFEVQCLQMTEQVGTDVRLDTDTERMAPVGHDIVADRAKNICKAEDQHHQEECPVGVVRKQGIHHLS